MRSPLRAEICPRRRAWPARAALTALIAISFLLPTCLHAQTPPIYLVLFTHIEDNTPAGTLGSLQSRQNYLLYRSRLIALANLARDSGIPWTLQPDWKMLQAALLYEDARLMATTNSKNFLRYLKEDLDAVIDPHSHENGGYNYTDVAHLLDSLGVGGTTVIGGHIWDPSLPQFQEWDRYRLPVQGERYPWAQWRGDILMGSGTPNHVNDPVVSGVWRPRDRDHYFEHDSTANIVAIGQYKGTLADIPELVHLYEIGAVSTTFMLTSSYHIKPSTLTGVGGLTTIQDSVLTPVGAMRDQGLVIPTDFPSLVQEWQRSFGSRGYIFDARSLSGGAPESAPSTPAVALSAFAPNPFDRSAVAQYVVARETWVHLAIFDVQGREVAVLVNEAKAPGTYEVTWEGRGVAGGTYFLRLGAEPAAGVPATILTRKIVRVP